MPSIHGMNGFNTSYGGLGFGSVLGHSTHRGQDSLGGGSDENNSSGGKYSGSGSQLGLIDQQLQGKGNAA